MSLIYRDIIFLSFLNIIEKKTGFIRTQRVLNMQRPSIFFPLKFSQGLDITVDLERRSVAQGYE